MINNQLIITNLELFHFQIYIINLFIPLINFNNFGNIIQFYVKLKQLFVSTKRTLIILHNKLINLKTCHRFLLTWSVAHQTCYSLSTDNNLTAVRKSFNNRQILHLKNNSRIRMRNIQLIGLINLSLNRLIKRKLLLILQPLN